MNGLDKIIARMESDIRAECDALAANAAENAAAIRWDYQAQALAALPQADYIDLLAALAAENGSGDEELLLSARDREAVGAAVVDAANARKPGASFHLSGETRDTGGGLVLRRGRVELNCSFTEKLRQLRQEESSAVARLLFD